MQNTSTIMMVRPHNFAYNEQTAVNNTYQKSETELKESDIKKLAIIEFDNFVEALRAMNVDVIVIEDTDDPKKPDAIFPNNWITTHENNCIITYPVFARNRRPERREDIIDKLEDLFIVEKRYSLEQYEDENLFLEGTGSMILDRVHKIVYACISQRTDVTLLNKFSVLTGYRPVIFHAYDRGDEPIYHTNVMMSIGRDLSIICLESILDVNERRDVIATLESTGKTIVDISLAQVASFVGNMLEVMDKDGNSIMVMSDSAYRALSKEQLNTIKSFGKILNVDIKTIEKFGGGSARCMMAEIFLEK